MHCPRKPSPAALLEHSVDRTRRSSMYDPDAPLVTLDDIERSETLQRASGHVLQTPLLAGVQDVFELQTPMDLYLKLENMQVTGSFKPRGFLSLMSQLPEGAGTERPLITMSAGNAGKAFAYLAKQLRMRGHVVMPDHAPANRTQVIEGYGSHVERVAQEELQATVERRQREDGMFYLHSFDDVRLIAGHGSVGLEIVRSVPEAEVVVVCCGGGGLLAGVAAAVRLSGHTGCRVYGVEPHGSRTMYESFKAGKAVAMPVKSVAAGLSPPFAGSNAYRHCRAHVEGIVLVSEEELLSASLLLHRRGLVVEPSGAAAFAALRGGHVPDVEGRRVVAVITGGNVTPQELVGYSP